MMEVKRWDGNEARIDFDIIELIGLYKLSMAHIDPLDLFYGDVDIEVITARLQVKLSGMVGP